MAVFAIGVDMVEVERIQQLIRQYGDRFLNRVYTPTEREYCLKKAIPAINFAARFAAKEALFKATGFGLGEGMRWWDVEVINDSKGQPCVRLHGKTFQILKGKKIHLSLSHTQKLAVAMVVVEKE